MLIAENKNLLATVQDLQDRENYLRHLTKNAEFRLSECQAENENMYADIHALQENEKVMKKTNKNLTAEVDHLQRGIGNLRKEVCGLQCQLNESQEELRDRDEIKQELDHVKSLIKKQQAELRRLTTALHYRQEHEEFMNIEKNIGMDYLAQLESQIEIQNKQTKDLKTTVEDLHYQLEEAQQLLLKKDELIKEKNREMDYNQQVIMKCYTLTMNLKKLLGDLMVQMMRRQKGKIQAGKDYLRAKSWALESPAVEVQQESPAAKVLLQEFPAAEVVVQESPAAEVLLRESPAAEVLLQETPAVEVLLQETPAAEVLLQESPAFEVLPQESAHLQEIPASKSSWRYYGKRLLIVGLCAAGITAAGILISAATPTTIPILRRGGGIGRPWYL
ncbi:hypothetical protein F2P81_000728 [Scophthalmus maximus]|uniref:Uncharacterized protein n=1 Tax=Scophthalmus maximus TaxID=52904 RepID=A0A6A4TP74_SCOMX|nr:hypothetical protein F2P81_000728 [Scophthalmus maximus]